MFKYFEAEVIEEIRNTKSRITISFDRWESKYEKIGVLGVVHFINNKYEAVTRVIGLPELPGMENQELVRNLSRKHSPNQIVNLLWIKLQFSSYS